MTRFGRAFLTALALGGSASANGRFPATNQILVHPGNPEQIVLRTTFGLLRSRDSGAHWDWECEQALGYSGTVDPPLAWHRNGLLVAGLFDGLSVAQEDSCSWRRDPSLGSQVVVDVSLHDPQGMRLDALTGSYDHASPAGRPAYVSDLWTSSTDGRVWSRSSTPLPPDVIVESFDRASSDAQRVYVTGESETGGARAGVLLRSRDGGASWQRLPFAFDGTGERALLLAAIDPARSDRLYVRTGGSENGRVLVSDDAGDTFRVVWTGAAPQGFALAADSSTVWVGSSRGGLERASTADHAFTTVNRTPIGCLHLANEWLYACSLDAYGFAAARSRDRGATFEPLLRLAEIRGPRPCADEGGANPCLGQWAVVKATVGIPDTVDAGPTPRFDGGTAEAVQTGSCGCRLGQSPSTAGGPAGAIAPAGSLAFLGAILGLARARLRRRSCVSP